MTGSSRGGGLRQWLRPRLLGLHLFAVVAVIFCVLMGLWQLGIYDSRQTDERADRQVVPRVELAEVWGPDDPFEARLNQRPVTATGEFAPDADQFWVTDRDRGGVRGAWLVAPLLTGPRDALLVVRGWAPAPGDAPGLPAGQVSVQGVLQPGDGQGAPWDPDRREIGAVRIPALSNELPYDLYSGYAISTDRDLSGGLVLASPPEQGVSWTIGLRNLAYALQWWVFGLFALFMWWRMAGESVAKGDRSEVAGTAG